MTTSRAGFIGCCACSAGKTKDEGEAEEGPPAAAAAAAARFGSRDDLFWNPVWWCRLKVLELESVGVGVTGPRERSDAAKSGSRPSRSIAGYEGYLDLSTNETDARTLD